MEFIVDGFKDLTANSAPQHSTLHYRYLTPEKKPFLLILPGGGYTHLAGDHEGSAIAYWGEKQGFHTGVFMYQVPPTSPESLITDLHATLDFLRKEKQVGKIFVLGFSAGAHYAGLFAFLPQLKPDGVIFCYPVVSFSEEFAHRGSAENFLQADYPKKAASYSLEKIVPPDAPPAFIWQTVADDAVSVANALALAKAYTQVNRPYELHLFPEGRHGLGMLNEVPHTTQWVNLLANWLQLQLNLE